ncbi:MAG: thiamine pyrophosphate-dependent dehydrogenase E1 component subunit alpha [Nannocystaceae bacterium]
MSASHEMAPRNTMMQTVVGPDERRALLTAMIRIRRIEERIAKEYPRGLMRCPVHLSIGQEAAAVGACAVLRRSDKITSTHRCHAHYLAKGGDLKPMIAELHGRASGCCGGRGGSMHLFDDAAGVVASVPIVGGNVPLGVGLALAAKQRRDGSVAATFFGDGALEEGVVHESANLAATLRLPIVFVLENNLYSVYTRLDQRQPLRSMSRFADAHGMPAMEIDGNDVLSMRGAMLHAVTRARRGDGPSLLVAHTYRQLEHCGPADDDHLGYRPAGELSRWAARCPIQRLSNEMLEQQEIDEATLETIEAAIAREIDDAFAAALAAPFPAAHTITESIHA